MAEDKEFLDHLLQKLGENRSQIVTRLLEEAKTGDPVILKKLIELAEEAKESESKVHHSPLEGIPDERFAKIIKYWITQYNSRISGV